MQICIKTITGRRINLLEMTPDDVSLDDIAGSLSHQCRWIGHVREPYSVAQHSVHVLEIARCMGTLEERHGTIDRNLCGWALLHDAAEAYLGDIHGPLKQWLCAMHAAFRELVRRSGTFRLRQFLYAAFYEAEGSLGFSVP